MSDPIHIGDELILYGLCPCGHEVSWHSDVVVGYDIGVSGVRHMVNGCQYKGKGDKNLSRDSRDYCTCPAKRSDFVSSGSRRPNMTKSQ